MSELVYALKARFDKIYEKYDNDEYDGNYNQSEVDDYYEIKKLIKKYINKTTINDTIINHIMFIDGYDYKYIYMVLLNYEYKFTNMIVLFSFFFNFKKTKKDK
jgi:Trk K+ transport system NAD-binding subunit